MSGMTVEARLQRLEDIEAVRQLKYRYTALCDEDFKADGIAELFTEDAIWDGGPLGRCEGREAIRAFFGVAAARMPFAIHHVTNPLIEVDADRATGRWYLWQPCVVAEGNQAAWIAGRYFDRCRRQSDGWRFEHVRIELRMFSPYESGWAKTPLLEIPQ